MRPTLRGQTVRSTLRVGCAALLVALGLVGGARAADDSRPRTLDDAVRRLHVSTAEASACREVPAVRGEARWECRTTECPGACQVVHLVTVLGERNGRFRRVSQDRQRRGDTGECGCCM